jgi:hypothetical protein
MKSKLLYFFLFPIISIAQPAANNVFKFHLNHIDIAVDSVTLHSLMNNKFISDTFSSTKLFRDSTGTEILVRGQDHWLHFLPDKGFYKNRLGAAVLIHENFTWIETNTIIKHLQLFTKDSLYNRPYTSGGENTAHIHIYENLADSLSLLKFIPQLQKFSKANYISWGYTEADLANGISQKRNMQDYVGKETSDKLFKSIEKIKVTASRDELRRIPPLMRAYGYKRTGNNFSLEGSPLVTMKPMKKNIRKTSVHIKLAKPAAKRTISLSNNAVLIIDGYNAWFNYTISSNVQSKK